MRSALIRTVAPTVEPVDLQTAKNHCRVTIDDDDDLITTLIRVARAYCEGYTGRVFLEQTWRLSLPHFPGHRRLEPLQGYGWGSCGHQLQVWGPGQFENRFNLSLPNPRLIAVTSLKYYDPTGALQTLVEDTDFIAAADYEPAVLTPAPGKFWPFAVAHRPDAVQITYTAGYGATAAAVPASIVQAMLLLISHLYENREASILPTSGTGLVEIPLGVEALLSAETLAPSFE